MELHLSLCTQDMTVWEWVIHPSRKTNITISQFNAELGDYEKVEFIGGFLPINKQMASRAHQLWVGGMDLRQAVDTAYISMNSHDWMQFLDTVSKF